MNLEERQTFEKEFDWQLSQTYQFSQRIFSLPKSTKHLGGHHDRSFVPVSQFTATWILQIWRAASVYVPFGAEDQPCGARVIELT